MSKILRDISWHSAMGIDSIVDSNKPVIAKLENTKEAKAMFYEASAGKFLIHKTSQALWRISEDEKSIEPVFSSDVLSEEDLKEKS